MGLIKLAKGKNMTKSSRRSCLKRTTLAVGCTVLPSYLTAARKKSDKLPPSERLNLACIGVGGRAAQIVPSLCKGGMAEPVAFCDVDFERPKLISRNLTAFPDAKRFNDFRVMFDKVASDIDIVSVAVPDHSHFCAAILAMSLGKHVYVEKPLTRTFEESEILMRAEKKFGVVTQMGNQGHTGSGIDQFQKMVDLGLFKNANKMEAWKTPSLWFMKEKSRFSGKPSVDPIPPSLNNYDIWCGPRRKLPYNKLYHPFDWRGFYEFGMGMLGDWGAHVVDYAHDRLELGLPTKLKSIKMVDHNQVIYPISSQLSMHFPARKEFPAMDLIWRDGADCHPEVPEQFWDEGKDGTSVAPKLDKAAGTLIYSEQDEFAVIRGHHGASSRVIPREQLEKYYAQLKGGEKGADHFASFINACKGEGTPNSRFSIAGKLAQTLALGTIVQYLNPEEELTFDPVKKQFVGNDEANALLAPPTRKGWEEFYKMA